MNETDAKGRPTVLMLAYHFAPDNSSGTHRSLHFAKGLVDAGWDVRVITAALEELPSVDESLNALFPHPEKIVRVPSAPTVGDYYLRLKGPVANPAQTEGTDRLDSTRRAPEREPKGLTAPLTFVRRQLVAWDQFPDDHRGWRRGAIRAGLEIGAETDVALVFVSGPPWTAVFAATSIARRLGKPLVTDFRDPFTRHTGRFNEYPERWIRALAARWEKRIFRRASLALFATPGTRRLAEERYGGAASPHFQTILNGSDVVLNEASAPLDPEQPLCFRHFGSLYRGRSMAPLLRGLQAALAVGGGAEAAPRIQVEQVGPGPIPDRDLEALPLPTSVEVLHVPELPFREATQRMLEPAVLVVTQPPTFRYQIPTKLFDYLCTGNPVLVIAPEDSDTWTVARGFSRCHRIEDDASASETAAVVEALIRDWRSGTLQRRPAGNDAAVLTKKKLAEQFVAALGEVSGTA